MFAHARALLAAITFRPAFYPSTFGIGTSLSLLLSGWLGRWIAWAWAFGLLAAGPLAAALIVLSIGNVPVAFSQDPGPQLKMVSIDARSPGEVQKLAGMGLDIAAVRKGPEVEGDREVSVQTYRVEAVVSSRDEKKLADEGFSWADVPGKGPAKKIGLPYNVYHSFDEPITGIRAQLQRIHAGYYGRDPRADVGFRVARYAE